MIELTEEKKDALRKIVQELINSAPALNAEEKEKLRVLCKEKK